MRNIRTYENYSINESADATIPEAFKDAVKILSNSFHKNISFIKAALGIIGRESDYGKSSRFRVLNPLKTIAGTLTDKSSSGYGQISAVKAKELGYTVKQINTELGALAAVYDIVESNYEKAKKTGYSVSSATANFNGGTGIAALDIAIMGFNTGAGRICNYCETDNPKIKRNCDLAGKKSGDLTVTDKRVPNYLPNFKTDRWDNVEITSHGYVKEVAEKMKAMSEEIDAIVYPGMKRDKTKISHFDIPEKYKNSINSFPIKKAPGSAGSAGPYSA